MGRQRLLGDVVISCMKGFRAALSITVLTCNCFADPAAIGLDLGEVRRAATNARSVFLSQQERVTAVETFVKLARIKGPSGQEGAVREEVQRLLIETGARTIKLEPKREKAP